MARSLPCLAITILSSMVESTVQSPHTFLITGALTKTAWNRPSRPRTSTSASKDSLEIAVVDTGEGISPEDLDHVFDRFWRADRSRARAERWTGGSGLGISVAQSLLEAQGGSIWAESRLGEGSTFRLTLPLA